MLHCKQLLKLFMMVKSVSKENGNQILSAKVNDKIHCMTSMFNACYAIIDILRFFHPRNCFLHTIHRKDDKLSAILC